MKPKSKQLTEPVLPIPIEWTNIIDTYIKYYGKVATLLKIYLEEEDYEMCQNYINEKEIVRQQLAEQLSPYDENPIRSLNSIEYIINDKINYKVEIEIEEEWKDWLNELNNLNNLK